MDSPVVPHHFRVGTWNVEGRADTGAVDLLLELRADVLLLTEVHTALRLPGYQITKLAEDGSRGSAAPGLPAGQHYAAIAAHEELKTERLSPPAITSAALASVASPGGLGLTVHTEDELAQPTRNGKCHAIDHIASRRLKRPVEMASGAPYSTHDAYVVDLAAPPFTGP